MNILVIDADRTGLGFCWRCTQAGHKVRWFVKYDKADSKSDGDGFKGIEKIQNWVSSVGWANLIWVTINSDYMSRLERMKEQGAPYFGPSVKSSDLEIKRAQGMMFLLKHGIEVPPYKTFKSLKEAEQHVWKNEKRWVFKTLGDNEDKSLSYCSKSPADMIARLRRWQELGLNPKGEVMLQEFIEGIELGVSRWLGSAGWVSPPNLNWEHKKLMSGNYGPNTGETGSVLTYVEQDKLATQVLDPLEESLIELGHLGDTDLNCIIDDKGKAWPLEFTTRPGWPAFYIMLAEHKGDPAQWMKDAIAGKATLDVSREIAVGIQLAVPRFPYNGEDRDESDGIPIYGLHKGNLKHVQPMMVKQVTMPDMDGQKVVERPIWATAGEYVGVVTALGSTVSVAAKRAYSTVKEISIPDMIVRDDVGEGLKDTLPVLHKLGYATSVTY